MIWYGLCGSWAIENAVSAKSLKDVLNDLILIPDSSATYSWTGTCKTTIYSLSKKRVS
jgi:hypothetical protein